MVQNVSSGAHPKILDLFITCLESGLIAILYTIYAVELKPANTMQAADSHNYGVNKWCFISGLLARCPM